MRRQTLDCSEALEENCSPAIEPLEMNRGGHFHAIDFGFVSQDKQKEVAEDRRTPSTKAHCLEFILKSAIINYPPLYAFATTICGVMEQAYSNKKN